MAKMIERQHYADHTRNAEKASQQQECDIQPKRIALALREPTPLTNGTRYASSGFPERKSKNNSTNDLLRQ